jgi:hypothetical protein
MEIIKARFNQMQTQLKAKIMAASALVLLMSINLAYTQEQRNLKLYCKETGNAFLQDGFWLKKDRKRQTEVWKKANLYNLTIENGNTKYKTISQIRDFYYWFDFEREKLGHEIKWIGIASIAAGQLSKLDNGFVRLFVVRNQEIVEFAEKGSKKVLEYAFPLLKEVYFSKELIKGKNAENWDLEYGMNEQCVILDPLYKELSFKAQCKFDRMAVGKGVFRLGVPKKLKYVGSIEDCQARFDHGIDKMLPYYLAHQKKAN